MNSYNAISTDQHLVIYFQVHQPRRLKAFQFFDIGSHPSYFNDKANEEIIKRIAKECYLPTNTMLLKLIGKYPQIKIAFSISGGTLDQFEKYTPEVLDSFKFLALTGSVEFLAETNYHSLASMLPTDEFETQIIQHAEKIYRHFGIHPNFFRNTELIYNDEIGKRVHDLGFDGIFCDGIYRILGQQSPHFVYKHPDQGGIKILLRNYRLSDDIAFRFNQHGSTLTVTKYLSWLNAIPVQQRVVNVAMDYETFGEHHKKESGILSFLENLLEQLATQKKFRLSTPSEVIKALPVHNTLPVPHYVSWADQERDLSAWLGNDMQRDAFDTLKKMESTLKQIDNPELLDTWRNLMTSDHFYYMSTKKDDDGNVHAYFSPYASPYEAFINFMNVLSDFSLIVNKAKQVHADTIEKANQNEFERRHEETPLWAEKYAGSYDHGHLG
jgi:alpha-amylase